MIQSTEYRVRVQRTVRIYGKELYGIETAVNRRWGQFRKVWLWHSAGRTRFPQVEGGTVRTTSLPRQGQLVSLTQFVVHHCYDYHHYGERTNALSLPPDIEQGKKKKKELWLGSGQWILCFSPCFSPAPLPRQTVTRPSSHPVIQTSRMSRSEVKQSYYASNHTRCCSCEASLHLPSSFVFCS